MEEWRIQSETFSTNIQFSSFNQKAGILTGAIGIPRAYNLQHNGDFRNIDVPRQENQHHMLTSNTTMGSELRSARNRFGVSA